MSRNSHWRCAIKKAVLKNLAIFIGKHLCWSLFNEVVPTQLFSCEYYEIFKNTYFKKHLRTVASACRLQQQSNICLLNWMKWGKI